MKASIARVEARPAPLPARPDWERDPSFLAEYERQYPYEAAADAILQLRAELGWTQQELAERIGTTQSVVARAESGRHSFQISFFNRIAEASQTRWRPFFEPDRGLPDEIVLLANMTGSSELPFVTSDVGFNKDEAGPLTATANTDG